MSGCVCVWWKGSELRFEGLNNRTLVQLHREQRLCGISVRVMWTSTLLSTPHTHIFCVNELGCVTPYLSFVMLCCRYLNDNAITAIPTGSFDGFSSLTNLWVLCTRLSEHVRRDTHPCSTLCHCIDVSCRYLDDNAITAISTGAFDAISSLIELWVCCVALRKPISVGYWLWCIHTLCHLRWFLAEICAATRSRSSPMAPLMDCHL